MARPAKVETGFASGRAIDSQISARRYSQTAHTLAGRALKSEFLAKVKTAYIRIVNDLVRTALSQDFPGIDDIGAIGETERFAHIVVGDQDADAAVGEVTRSEEHTSELQSLTNLVCRLLLEKKKYIH